MTLGSHPKIVLSFFLFGAAGISGFFVARNYVNNNRQEAMRIRQAVKYRLKQEREEEERLKSN